MKRVWTPLIVLGLALGVWISTIAWLPHVTAWLRTGVPVCEADHESEKCARVLAQYGVTGDLFGAVNSLFSGLALFAVAWTLWADNQSRREARRPLLVFRLNDDGVILNEANFGEPKSLRLEIDGHVQNMGEPALNVLVDLQLSPNGRPIKLEAYTELLPLATNTETKASFKARLHRDDIRSLMAAFGQPPHSVKLQVTVTCTNLEGVGWRSTVTYVLECDKQSKLQTLLGHDDAEFERHWSGGAELGLRVRAESGSWSHTRAVL